MRKLWLMAAAIPLMCVMCLAGAPAAQAAAVTNVCGNGGSGYCLNAWNGGPYVRMYYGHSSNENFQVEGVDTCMGSGAVMSTRAGDPINCPFSDPNLDYNLRGAPTVRIVYFLPSGTGIKCVGTGNLNGQRDVGYLGSCGDPYGNGIIQGGIDVVDFGNLTAMAYSRRSL